MLVPRVRVTHYATPNYGSEELGHEREGFGEFPGGPLVRTLCFHCQGPRFNPWLGNKDPRSHSVQPKKKKERERGLHEGGHAWTRRHRRR